ncbi:transmembrane protein 54 [Apus apus]|uniref:transmembrane protein 54 n=1 Tax=Apus apus TaxID=8895 RepID=UPI0021F8B222|nr:transmembrane protein 54 [Apus apus]
MGEACPHGCWPHTTTLVPGEQVGAVVCIPGLSVTATTSSVSSPTSIWGTSSGAVPKHPVALLATPTLCHLLVLLSLPGHLDPSSHQRVLMKTGLILLIIGHLNFIAGGLVHGIVLRFVVDPQDPISLLYGVTNVTSAIAALLTISCGLAALLLSRCPAPAALPWGVLALSAASCGSCLCCLLGLAVAIGLTLGDQGRALLAPCTPTKVALAPVSHQCPFDPTRVYSSTLCLWVTSLLLDSLGIVFGIRCLLLILRLLRLGRCCRGTHRRKVSLQVVPVETPSSGQCLGLLRLDSVETARL